ncbi:AUGMIN subunit like [Actinidia chinensis var. chinensis]|uniref:AUGMIN subunit like n=1 Tax=Actinidia chinensis var. chinensis TaxID=1590841 RepID=A0A2R6QPU9_ACTCC|nr:AUGMIN subunit like [Actinidia chinensis var. chinensis]
MEEAQRKLAALSVTSMALLQGRGIYEDCTEMLPCILNLVEASIFANNSEWWLESFIFLFLSQLLKNMEVQRWRSWICACPACVGITNIDQLLS